MSEGRTVQDRWRATLQSTRRPDVARESPPIAQLLLYQDRNHPTLVKLRQTLSDNRSDPMHRARALLRAARLRRLADYD